MDAEGGVQLRRKKSSWGWQKGTLLLAYQSFGVVYGDLCISPVYVYKNTFSGKLRLHEEDEEILGVLSLVFWSLTLIPLLKYIILVLGADDNGEGGTFALYSLMCRRSRMGLLNSLHAGSVSAYNQDEPCKESRSSLIIRGFFERHYSLRVVLLLFVLMGTSMVIGDGVLTPTMSVLSAVSGLRIKFPELHENYTVLVACIVLVGLFALQHYGTHRVGFLFAPILISWLACIGGIGIYNILKWNPSVVRALSPYYIYNFFRKAGKDGWSSLGGIVLCITGAEAMFADLGHFSKLSLRLGFTIVVYPCLVLAYMGEAAYLSKHREDLQSSFYKALPDRVFWPVLIIATLATAVGSQAIISATFSIISQCRALGCFPRIKVVHTSSHVHGQIYIPEVNWTLMFLCLAVTIGFRDTEMIGNAYGLAVILVMFATTCLMFLVITTVWNRSVVWAALFAAGFGSVELLYLSACLAKVPHGGWLPLLLSLATLLVMSAWHYGTAKKQEYELQNKVCLDHLLGLIGSGGMGLVRVPGVGFVYSDAGAGTTGVPPMFAHFVTNFPAFHRVLVFVSLQTLTVPKVPPEERFLVGRIGRPEYRLFRCVVRYGYKEGRWDHFNFENQLLVKVVEFLRLQAHGADGERSSSASGEMSVIPAAPSQAVVDALASMSSCEIDYAGNDKGYSKKVRFEEMPPAAAWRREETRSEVRELLEEREAGVSYMVGHTCVFAHESSSAVKKFAVNVVYGFLRRNSRRPAVVLGIPHTSLIEVGMAYRV